MDNSIFIKNIKYLVTCDEDENLFENINMYIEDGVFLNIDEEKIYHESDVVANRFIRGV